MASIGLRTKKLAWAASQNRAPSRYALIAAPATISSFTVMEVAPLSIAPDTRSQRDIKTYLTLAAMTTQRDKVKEKIFDFDFLADKVHKIPPDRRIDLDAAPNDGY